MSIPTQWHRFPEETPPPEKWCWVSNGEWVNVAFFSAQYGNWSNGDTWQDWDREITHWVLIDKPQPPTEASP